MSQTQKFLFETSFDSAEGGAAGDATCPLEPETYGKSDLEQAYDEGLAAGREQGLKDAAESIENSVARTLEQISQKAQSLLETGHQEADQRDADALRAALTIVRKLFPNFTKTHGLAEIEGLVGQCLQNLRDEPRVAIRINDEIWEALQTRLDPLIARSGYEGKLVVLADDTLLPGEARVEWADGGAERDTTRLWHEIDETIARATKNGRAAIDQSASPDVAETPQANGMAPGGVASDPSTASTASNGEDSADQINHHDPAPADPVPNHDATSGSTQPT